MTRFSKRLLVIVDLRKLLTNFNLEKHLSVGLLTSNEGPIFKTMYILGHICNSLKKDPTILSLYIEINKYKWKKSQITNITN